ncbi:MAG TPA: Uma2 family endonuclease [Fimbriiglobus sp.]
MSTHVAKRPKIPPLQPGDRLTRPEFERRYQAMPQVKKAELIEGVVYMPSPVRFEAHGEEHSDLIGWLVVYKASTPGVRTGDNSTVRLDNENEPQPDVTLIIDPKFGGQTALVDGYISGPPELVAEVSASTVSIDLHDKLRAYQRNGVAEYIVWRTEDGAIDWFVLREGKYEPLPPDADGLWKSPRFPGLWLDGPAMARGDMPAVFSALHRGLVSPEHQAFVDRVSTATPGAPAE